MKSAQNLSPGRFRHAEAESEVKNLQNFHPDLEISISYYYLLVPIISYDFFFWGGAFINRGWRLTGCWLYSSGQGAWGSGTVPRKF